MLEGCVPWPDELAQRYRRQAYWQGRPLGDLLLETCAEHADRVAIVCGEQRLTYAEVADRSDRLARHFAGLGIGPLDRVVVQLPNVPEFATVVFALFRLGAIPVMALPGHRKHELVHLCSHSGAIALVVMSEFKGFDYKQLAQEVQQEVPAVKQLLIADELSLDAGETAYPVLDPSEPALFLLSGGTTGLPKLIPRTHDDYAYNMLATTKALEVDASSTYLAVNPVAHNSALGCPGLFGTLLVGGKVVLASTPRPAELFELIREERVTFTTLVPATVRMWIDHALRTPVDLSGVHLQIGSSKLTPGQAEEARKYLGCGLSQWFGVGEGLLTYTRLDDPDDVILNTEGRPLAADDEIRVVDEAGLEVADNVDGELLARGPYTIRGYYRAAEQNSGSFTPDGFFRTGDLVRRGPDGNIVVVGRLKDVINRAGDKVPAEDVEEQLVAHPGVRDAAVIGVEDAVLGERTYAFVVLRDADLKTPALKAFLRQRGLATYKIPDKIESVAELPRTPVGKADKVALRALAANRTP
ncbi:(2,3-dihydroxybenzoyl)adenylate synthase [Kribbella qitaiheensis]|uniref:(2,3-dihydroxybenzoyl)adenylate synthase n=1 Tax=Kribbella qitaiheensis TaxID=1544730 RepID=A0A7G6WSR1_9ACTN|nr:AMP-binding protein [Kribbella qitaiheensis]QNE17026.1 (2,3-dihydroxybenzoyl)adenylate synthase [Kribbella qitaiheensis]